MNKHIFIPADRMHMEDSLRNHITQKLEQEYAWDFAPNQPSRLVQRSLITRTLFNTTLMLKRELS